MLQSLDYVIKKRHIELIHSAVAVDIHRMQFGHGKLVQVPRIHYAVLIKIRAFYDFRQVCLYVIQEGEHIIEAVKVLHVYDLIAVNVSVYEHVYELPHPVFVIRGDPSITIHVRHFQFFGRDRVTEVFYYLLHEDLIVIVYSAVSVNVDLSLQHFDYLLQIKLAYDTVIVYVILHKIIKVYLPRGLRVLVNTYELFHVKLTDLPIPVDVKYVISVYQRPIEYGHTFREQGDIGLCYFTVAVHIRLFDRFFGNIHGERFEDLPEPVRVVAVYNAVIIEVLEFFKHIKHEHLIRCVNGPVGVDIRHLDLFSGHYLVALGGKLEHALYVVNVPLGGPFDPVHVRSLKYVEHRFEYLYVVAVQLPVPVYIGLPYVFFRKVQLDRFDHSVYILKVETAYVTVAIHVQGGIQDLLYGCFILYGYDPISINVPSGQKVHIGPLRD